jgi:hypothetical protein
MSSSLGSKTEEVEREAAAALLAVVAAVAAALFSVVWGGAISTKILEEEEDINCPLAFLGLLIGIVGERDDEDVLLRVWWWVKY